MSDNSGTNIRNFYKKVFRFQEQHSYDIQDRKTTDELDVTEKPNSNQRHKNYSCIDDQTILLSSNKKEVKII